MEYEKLETQIEMLYLCSNVRY